MITGINHILVLEAFEDALALDDMVWYKNIDSQGTGDDDINEIMEHILHTLHRFGVRGGVEGSTEALKYRSRRRRYHQYRYFSCNERSLYKWGF